MLTSYSNESPLMWKCEILFTYDLNMAKKAWVHLTEDLFGGD